MKFLKEVLTDVRRMNQDRDTDDQDEFAEKPEGDDEFAEKPEGDDGEASADGDPDDEFAEKPEGEEGDPNADAGGWDVPAGGGSAGGGLGGSPDADPQADPDTDSETPEGDEDSDIDGLVNKATEDPNRMGLVRTVKGAHLIYKRETEDGSYEELWIYNIGSMKDELDVRKSILAGTDIPTNKMASPDGSQVYKIWAAGNAEVLAITGLPN